MLRRASPAHTFHLSILPRPAADTSAVTGGAELSLSPCTPGCDSRRGAWRQEPGKLIMRRDVPKLSGWRCSVQWCQLPGRGVTVAAVPSWAGGGGDCTYSSSLLVTVSQGDPAPAPAPPHSTPSDNFNTTPTLALSALYRCLKLGHQCQYHGHLRQSSFNLVNFSLLSA